MTFIHFRGIPAAATKSLQLCPTLCHPIYCLLPGFSVPGILQARTLEWGAIAFSGDIPGEHAKDLNAILEL